MPRGALQRLRAASVGAVRRRRDECCGMPRRRHSARASRDEPSHNLRRRRRAAGLSVQRQQPGLQHRHIGCFPVPRDAELRLQELRAVRQWHLRSGRGHTRCVRGDGVRGRSRRRSRRHERRQHRVRCVHTRAVRREGRRQQLRPLPRWAAEQRRLCRVRAVPERPARRVRPPGCRDMQRRRRNGGGVHRRRRGAETTRRVVRYARVVLQWLTTRVFRFARRHAILQPENLGDGVQR